MKWLNPSHEFDSAYAEYKRIMEKHQWKLIVFGTGEIGNDCIEVLNNSEWVISGAIDNDPNKWGAEINDHIEISSFTDYMLNQNNGYLIIAASDKASREIEEQLKENGLKEKEDYCLYKEFVSDIVPVLELYKNERLWLNVVELSLTERCTLRCRKCAHGCGYVSPLASDMPLERAKLSADNLFEFVDHVNEFYLIGGEPLLYNSLSDIIIHVGERYRDRINRFIVTTNGTLIPDKKILEAAAKFDLVFYISNYSVTLPRLQKKYDMLMQLLSENHVTYKFSGKERVWFDYGFDHVDHGFNLDIVESVHDGCFTQCREIRGSKLYYCIQARSIAENMGFDVDDDGLDITRLDEENAKRIIFEYSKGYCPKGYIDMCNYCNGSQSLDYCIAVAEQM